MLSRHMTAEMAEKAKTEKQAGEPYNKILNGRIYTSSLGINHKNRNARCAARASASQNSNNTLSRPP
jgi:hypothetical protein